MARSLAWVFVGLLLRLKLEPLRVLRIVSTAVAAAGVSREGVEQARRGLAGVRVAVVCVQSNTNI